MDKTLIWKNSHFSNPSKIKTQANDMFIISRSLPFLYFFQNSELRHFIALKSRPLNWPMKMLVLLYKISRHLKNNINEHRWKKMGKFWQVDYPRLAGDELRRNHNPKCWWKKVGVYIVFFFPFNVAVDWHVRETLCPVATAISSYPEMSNDQKCGRDLLRVLLKTG